MATKSLTITMAEDEQEDSAMLQLADSENWKDSELVFAIITIAGQINERRKESMELTFCRIIEAMDNYWEQGKTDFNLH